MIDKLRYFKTRGNTNGFIPKKSSSFFTVFNYIYIYKIRRIIDFLNCRETKREKKEY